MSAKKLIPQCTHCGGTDISLDAYAAWSIEEQDWTLKTTFDEAVCEDCQGECNYDMVEAEE